MVYFNVDNNWIKTSPETSIIFVIRPGAGTFKNKEAYKNLEKGHRVIYFGMSGDEYDNYPENWQNNSLVLNTGKNLGGLCQHINNYMIQHNIIPSAFIVGSRGGQVTIGKIWESIWRGPTIIINAGCLITNTIIPKYVTPLFITMEHDYFKNVNTPNKVNNLFKKLREHSNIIGYLIHLKGHGHMPRLTANLTGLLSECIKLLYKSSYNITDMNDAILYKLI